MELVLAILKLLQTKVNCIVWLQTLLGEQSTFVWLHRGLKGPKQLITDAERSAYIHTYISTYLPIYITLFFDINI